MAAGSKIGIVVYHTPGATNVELSPQFIRRLAQIDGIAAVKETIDETHTSASYMLTRDISHFCIMEANEPLLLPSFAIGIDAAFSIILNLLPREGRELYDLVFQKNDIAAARALNEKCAAIFMMMEEEPYPGPVKAGLDAIENARRRGPQAAHPAQRRPACAHEGRAPEAGLRCEVRKRGV